MTLFEKIITREIPAYIIYEDTEVIAFLDITQNTLGHTLVVPKKVSKSFLDVEPHILDKVMHITQKLSNEIIKIMEASGANIIMNCNEIAGQSVDHFHVHIIPRFDAKELEFKTQNHGDQIEIVFDKLKELSI